MLKLLDLLFLKAASTELIDNFGALQPYSQGSVADSLSKHATVNA